MPRTWLIIISVAVAVLVGLLAWLGRVKQPGSDRIVVDVFDRDDIALEPERPREDIIALATQQERELWWYTSAPEEHARQFLSVFESKYPAINARVNPGESRSTFQVVEQVREELEGELRADVLHVLDVGVFLALEGDDQLLPYRSPEYAALQPKYRDEKGGYWGCMRAVTICMAYNERLLPPGQSPPRTWRDLWDPVWADGKIALETASAGSQYAQYFFLRDLYGRYHWETLARQGPKFYDSSREILEALEQGDVLIAGEMMGYALEEWRREGHTNIVGVWPEDGVPLALAPVAILKRAKHPNAARLFVDFAMAKEGQELWQRLLGAYSVREDVEPPPGRRALADMNVLSTDNWPEYVAKQRRLRSDFRATFDRSFD
ncbi:MAG: extracellular solute-binding protein [Armatimonadota bacterium]|jgi:iron(III) transport system substrate-binding protein